MLQWDVASQTWIPVVAPTGTGQIVFWDQATQLWTLNPAPGAVGDSLVWTGVTWMPAGGGSVLPVGTANGNLLQWDAGTGMWIPVMAPTGLGQITFWDPVASAWTLNAAPGAAGETLVWNGTTWVPSGGGGALPAGTAEGNLLQWDTGTLTWIPVTAPTLDGQYAFWNQTTKLWTLITAPAATGVIYYWDATAKAWVTSGTPTTAGQTLIWNGTTWTVGGGGGALPAGIDPGDLLVWNGTAWVDGSAPNLFQTQAVWYVDPVGGNDANDGLTALTALKSVDNLSLRLWTPTSVLQQNTTIHILSSLPTGQVLKLPRLAAGLAGTAIGTTTVLHSGTITALANRVLGASPPTFTDAAIVDVAPYIDKRIKITAGAANGRWAFIEKKLAATQAEVSQWNIDSVEGNASANTYVIEDLPILGGVYYENPDTPDGFGTWTIRDCQVYKAYSNSADIAINFAGCKIGKTGAFASFGGEGGNLLGCYVVGNFVQFSGAWFLGACGSPVGTVIDVENGSLSIDYGLFQDQIHAGPNSNITLSTDNSIRNGAHPDEAFQVDPGSDGYLFSGALWGANPAVLYGLHVYTGGNFTQNAGTTISITGSTGTVANIGSAIIPLANLPFETNGARIDTQGSLSVIACSSLYAGTSTENAEATGSCVSVSNATSIRRGHIAYQLTNDAIGGRFVGLKNRVIGGVSNPVVSGDQVALLVGGGWDGADYSGSSRYVIEVDGAVAAGVVPMAATIYTGNGAAPTLRQVWSSAGAWSVPGLTGLTAGLIHSSAAGVLTTSLGAANQVYNTNGAGTDSQWSTIGGDVTGSIAAMVVGKINGATVPASPGAGAVGDSLVVSGAGTLAYGDNRDQIWFGAVNTGNSNAARWLPSGGAGITQQVAVSVGGGEVLMGRPGKVVAMYAYFRAAALAAANTTWTLVKNEVNTADTLTVLATVQSGNAACNTSFVAGDRIAVQEQTSAADATNSTPIVVLVIQYG